MLMCVSVAAVLIRTMVMPVRMTGMVMIVMMAMAVRKGRCGQVGNPGAREASVIQYQRAWVQPAFAWHLLRNLFAPRALFGHPSPPPGDDHDP